MKPIPRALRHLGLTLASWIGCRFVFVAWADYPSQAHQNYVRPDLWTVAMLMDAKPLPKRLGMIRKSVAPPSPIREIRSAAHAFRSIASDPEPSPRHAAIGLFALPEGSPAGPSQSPHPKTIEPNLVPASASFDNWSLSAWAIYRPDSGSVSLSPTSQLGGSQFGFRVQRRLFQPIQNLALSLNLRASTPVKVSNGKEAALGLALRRAGRVPVEVIAERRVGLDRGGRNAFAGLIATGIYDLPVAAGFKLNGYAQAGIVGFRKHDGFADGSLRLEREVASARSFKVQLGGGVWGAVQPGASRVDIGPSAAVRFRVGSAGVRLGGEWRQRVSGDARPGSGPAITFGLDY